MSEVISLNDLIIKYFINNNISKVKYEFNNHDVNYDNAKKVDYKSSTKITFENTFNNLLAKEKEKRRERRR